MRIFLHIVGTVALVHPWIIRLHAIPLALKAVVLEALDVIELALPSNSGEKNMFCKRRISAVAAILLGIGVMLPVEAHAIELAGAWASQTDLCKMVFTKEPSRLYLPSFLTSSVQASSSTGIESRAGARDAPSNRGNRKVTFSNWQQAVPPAL